MLNKKLLTKIIIVGFTIFGVSMAADAAVSGPYVGGDIGIAGLHYNASDFLKGSHAHVSDTGLAGGVFGGYQFTQNFAAELGYTQFSQAEFKNINGTGLNGTTKENAIDLVGKAILPLQDGFSIFGKAGAAYVTAKTSKVTIHTGANGESKLTPPEVTPLDPVALNPMLQLGGVQNSNAGTVHRVLPTFGAGVSYDVTPNLPVSVSWTRIQSIGNSPIPSSDFVGVSLAYNFG